MWIIIYPTPGIKINNKRLGEALTKHNFEKWRQTENNVQKWVYSVRERTFVENLI